MKLATAAVLAALTATGAHAQVNVGAQPPEASLPFVMARVTTFNLPWRLAFLPDGRMLITEKVGPVWLVTQAGAKTPVANVPAVLAQGQGCMLGVFLSPHYKRVGKACSITSTRSIPTCRRCGSSSVLRGNSSASVAPYTLTPLAAFRSLMPCWTYCGLYWGRSGRGGA